MSYIPPPRPGANTGPDPQYPYTAEYPPKRKSRVWLIVLAALGVLAVLGCVIGLTLATGSPKKTATTAPTVAVTTRATANTKHVAPRVKPAAARVGPGTYLVGEEIGAGTYVTTGAQDGLCYWQESTDDAGNNIGAQGVTTGEAERGRVTLHKGRYFKTSGCKDWVRQ